MISTALMDGSDLTPAGPDRVSAVGDMADALGDVMRTMHRLKARLLVLDPVRGADWGSHALLARLVVDGPQRVTSLADLAELDASTVSRQVANLVKDGLIERQPDPGDGRASLLVATDRGQQAHAAFRGRRDERLAGMLADWSVADVDGLRSLLRRLAGALHASTPHLPADVSAPGREEN